MAIKIIYVNYSWTKNCDLVLIALEVIFSQVNIYLSGGNADRVELQAMQIYVEKTNIMGIEDLRGIIQGKTVQKVEKINQVIFCHHLGLFILKVTLKDIYQGL